MEKTTKIFNACVEIANSEKFQAVFGEIVEKMTEKEKIDFLIVLFFETLRKNEDLGEMVANEFKDWESINNL